MRELGRILQSARESLGLQLDEIEEKTKIRKRYLAALEEGNWTVLPGRVYARGFVRSYAEVVGLDGAELLQRYVDGQEFEVSEHVPPMKPSKTLSNGEETIRVSRVDMDETVLQSDARDKAARKAVAMMAEPRSLNEIQRQRTSAPKPERKPEKKSSSSATKVRRGLGGTVGQWFVIVAALVVVAGGLWFLQGQHTGKGSGSAAKTPPNPANSPTVNNTSTQSSGSPANTVGALSNATNNGSTSNAAGVVPSSPAQTVTPQAFQNGQITYLVQNATDLQVTLQVISGQCWISTTADGQVVDGNDTVNPGQSRSFHGTQSVLIRLGHVQGVQLAVNGQVLTLPNTQTAINVLIQRQGS